MYFFCKIGYYRIYDEVIKTFSLYLIKIDEYIYIIEFYLDFYTK